MHSDYEMKVRNFPSRYDEGVELAERNLPLQSMRRFQDHARGNPADADLTLSAALTKDVENI